VARRFRNVFTSRRCRPPSPAHRIFQQNCDTNVSDDALPGGAGFHGNLYYFHRNDALNAKNFSILSTRRSIFKYHFFGANSVE
jgi:hypothetical protein